MPISKPRPTPGGHNNTWGTVLNEYLAEVETAVERVDRGTTWVNASTHANLAAAYAALPSGGGAIFLPDGRHDVGAGLVLSRAKPVSLVANPRHKRGTIGYDEAPYPHPGAVLYSSTGAASLVTFDDDVFSNVYGFDADHVVFEMTAATTERAIFAPSISRANITNCVFWAAGAAPDDVVGITAYTDALLGDDTSWWRIQENTASMCALVEIGQSGNSSNHNQNVITGNWGIGRGIDVTAAKPMISLYYNHRGVVRDNNVESYHQGIYMENCWSCIESGDGGEAVRYFLDLKNTNATHFQPLGITQPASYGPAQLVRMTDHNYANVIILPAVTGASGLYTDIASAIALAGTAALNDSTIITPEGVYLDGPVTVTGSLAVSGAANFSGGGEYAGSANLSFWGSWNEAHLVIGAVHIWYDPGLPGLRAKVNAPTSATDGTVLLP